MFHLENILLNLQREPEKIYIYIYYCKDMLLNMGKGNMFMSSFEAFSYS